MEIVKRDLSAVSDMVASKEVKKTLHPLRDAMEGITPKGYLAVYGDYKLAGLAWCIDAMQAVTKREFKESEVFEALKRYASKHTVDKEGRKRIDLPLWISASAIVGNIAHNRPMGSSWYGLAWALYNADATQVANFIQCLPAEKPEAKLIKGSAK